MKMKLSTLVALAGTILSTTSAHASIEGTLTVGYTSAAAVPLSPWMMAALGIAVAGATAIAMRKRGLGQ